MLSSTRLVIQAQSIISDSEESRGYLSEGEQYRRSRFPRSKKCGSEHSYRTYSSQPNFMIRISPIISHSRDEKFSHNSPKQANRNSHSRKRDCKSQYPSSQEFEHDTTSDSEASDFEKSCPFYFSSLHEDQKKKNGSRRNYDHKTHGKGIYLSIKIFNGTLKNIIHFDIQHFYQ